MSAILPLVNPTLTLAEARHSGREEFANTANARPPFGANAEEIVAWAFAQFGQRLVMSSSFRRRFSHAATHGHTRLAGNPGRLYRYRVSFRETRRFVEQLTRRLRLNLHTYRPLTDSKAYLREAGELDPSRRADVQSCCQVNKVEPFERAMRELRPAGWLRGIRADQTATRGSSNAVEWSNRFSCWVVSPLLNWSNDAIQQYLLTHDLPVHPLVEKRYRSIGCAPLTCTRPVKAGEDPRAGRWAGSAKTECGLHIKRLAVLS